MRSADSMAASRTARLFAPWPKRIALFSYGLLILLTIASGAVQVTWTSGTRASASQTGFGIENGRVVFMHGSQFQFPGWFVDFNCEGLRWWIDWKTTAPPAQTYVYVPLWMLLVLF